MIFDLSNPLDKEQFKTRCNALYQRGVVVELTEKKHRTLNQNSYLHLILSYFASQYGERLEYIKMYIFKAHVNQDIFMLDKKDRLVGDVIVLRSTADITTAEMTLAIERFRNWSSKVAGIYIPEANEESLLIEMQKEVERNKRYL